MNTTATTDSNTTVNFEDLQEDQIHWAKLIGNTYLEKPAEFKIGDVVMATFDFIQYGHEPTPMTTAAIIIGVEFNSEIAEDEKREILYKIQPIDFIPGSERQYYDDDLPEAEASPEDLTLIIKLEDYAESYSNSTSVKLSDPEWEVVIQELVRLSLNPGSEAGEVLDQLRMQTGIGIEDVLYLSEGSDADEA